MSVRSLILAVNLLVRDKYVPRLAGSNSGILNHASNLRSEVWAQRLSHKRLPLAGMPDSSRGLRIIAHNLSGRFLGCALRIRLLWTKHSGQTHS